MITSNDGKQYSRIVSIICLKEIKLQLTVMHFLPFK